MKAIQDKTRFFNLLEKSFLCRFCPYDYDRAELVLKILQLADVPYKSTISVDKVRSLE